MDLRKILESVESGEILPEDAEKLIDALFDTENIPTEEIVDRTIEIADGETYRKNISMTNGRLIVRGEVLGNVSVVNTEIQLYGIIRGNLNAVHSKIFWNGGRIEGNANLVLTKEEGKANVEGKYNVVAFNMPFLIGL